MKYCNQCGEQLADSVKFCSNCGAKQTQDNIKSDETIYEVKEDIKPTISKESTNTESENKNPNIIEDPLHVDSELNKSVKPKISNKEDFDDEISKDTEPTNPKKEDSLNELNKSVKPKSSKKDSDNNTVKDTKPKKSKSKKKKPRKNNNLKPNIIKKEVTSKPFNKKLLIPVIIIIIVIAGVIIATNFSNTSTGEYDIKATSADLSGNDEDSFYSYTVNGMISNLPSNTNGFVIRSTFYDSNGKEVEVDVENLTENRKYSYNGVFMLSYYYSTSYVDMDHVDIELLNSDGDIVGNTIYKFNMEKMLFYDEDYNTIPNPHI